jgi:hypothetical protein
MTILQSRLLVIGLAVAMILMGTVSVANCYLNGLTLAPAEHAWLGPVWGGGLVGALLLSAILGELVLSAFARFAVVRGLLLLPLCLFFTASVLALSSGLIADARSNVVRAKQARIESHQHNDKQRELIVGAVEKAEAKNVSTKNVTKLLDSLQATNNNSQDAPPTSSDPLADLISKIAKRLGWHVVPATVGALIPPWLAVVVDSGCIISFSLLGLVGNQRKEQPPVKKQRKLPRKKWWSRRNANKRKSPPPAPKVPPLKIVNKSDDLEEVPRKRTLH